MLSTLLSLCRSAKKHYLLQSTVRFVSHEEVDEFLKSLLSTKLNVIPLGAKISFQNEERFV